MATTIPLKKDDDPDMTIWMCEQCCSCGKRTRWWTDLPDRKPGEQVALCLECAPEVDAKDIPSKSAWFDGARVKKKNYGEYCKMATKYLTEEGSSMLRAYMKMYPLSLTTGDLPELIMSHRRQREMIATSLASTELAKAREQGRRQAYEEAMKNDYISVDRLRGMTLGEMTDLLKEG